jgi:hypothetical protein
MPGKIPTRTKIETFFKKGVWDIIREEFSKCENTEQAANRLAHLTQGKIAVTPITILHMVEKGIEAKEVKENDFFYSWGVIVPTGKHRGKESIRSKVEKYIKKDFWTWLRSDFKDCTTKAEAVKKIFDLTEEKIEMKELTLSMTIEKGLETKEVKPDDFFVKWIVRKKHRAKKTETKTVSNGIEETKIKMTGTCSHCGQKAVIAITQTNLKEMGIGIRGKRCPGCQMWASFVFTGEVDGKQYTEEDKNWKKNNQNKFKKELAQG